MPPVLRILSVEDDPNDTQLIQDLLETDIACEVMRVDTQAQLLAALDRGQFDVILADYTLPSFDGITALKLATQARPEVPFIFVSGTLGEELAVESLKIGATDYILKTNLSRLLSSIQRALREAWERAERKNADEKLRRSEAYLAEAQRLSRTGSFGWRVASGEIYFSAETFRILGFEPASKPTLERILERTHPEDRPLVQSVIDSATRENKGFDFEHRLLMPDGAVKVLRVVGQPAEGDPHDAEFVGTAIDITEEHKRREALQKALEEIRGLKDQLYKENIALREEVDKTSMFEEIVGDSHALQQVLAQVSKVAPTDSTVLIMGETGTGKELIARAIHKRSQRGSRAFINVNCAAIPASLIASELFGHEKGAFTGALQRRLGRFEVADGGTIFLDEVGELPLEIQATLLRVLQEREFERVGGAQTVRVDLRVIAATNRDLQSAVAAGTFRSDLFYRLNGIPIEMPPLRKRKDDIPLLIDYFIGRIARKVGKRILSVDQRSSDLLESYSWPGNIRELQNVIERSVVICESDVLKVEEGWLSLAATAHQAEPRIPPLGRRTPAEEKKIIEAALAKAGGRVSGPAGAAAQLDMPASTLESKIRTLRIDKYRFKSP